MRDRHLPPSPSRLAVRQAIARAGGRPGATRPGWLVAVCKTFDADAIGR